MLEECLVTHVQSINAITLPGSFLDDLTYYNIFNYNLAVVVCCSCQVRLRTDDVKKKKSHIMPTSEFWFFILVEQD